MAISWSDAASDTDNSDDVQRYRRAVSQVYHLEPLVLSFADAVRKAGKWPQQLTGDDYSPHYVDGRISTRHDRFERHVWIYPDGAWGIEVGHPTSTGITGYLVKRAPGKEPQFWHSGGETATITAADFRTRMDAMEQAKDWVPRELVAYLRAQGIPIPDQ